jgi:hypothetical protein
MGGRIGVFSKGALVNKATFKLLCTELIGTLTVKGLGINPEGRGAGMCTILLLLLLLFLDGIQLFLF